MKERASKMLATRSEASGASLVAPRARRGRRRQGMEWKEAAANDVGVEDCGGMAADVEDCGRTA